MKKKFRVFLIIMLLVLSTTGCTKMMKVDKKVITNPETGQSLVENILCQPEDETTRNIYIENGKDLESLPKCTKLRVASGKYEGIWTTIFVKPLAWLIVKIGKLVKNYGLSIIIITLLIRLVLYPMTKKTALQSENMKNAKPELDKLEKKYKDKTDQQSMMQKSQEMMIIYKKYNISPISGCIFAFIQIPLFFAFYEALNRLPAIFEGKLLVFQLGTSPLTGITHGNYFYIIIIILVILSTYFSFKLNKTASMGSDQEKQMATMMKISIIFIGIASFTISTGIALYWIFNSGFTILQNLLVKRGTKNQNVIK